ncbi:enoyl-CoA hydratase/isomerase family protein [bacterium]|nr:enoyl-CoA hydratase/isomerase family protein [bacterium]
MTINRPGSRNALNGDVLDGIAAGVTAHESDGEVRVIVLTGAGDKAFCAGADLRPDPAAGMLAMHDGRGRFPEVLRMMMRCDKVIVARVNGHALGGGLGLVAACDLAVAADTAQLGTPEARLGLFPMMIMTLLARHVGRKRLLEMMFTGERFGAAEAKSVGLLNHVVPAADLDKATGELVERVAKMSLATLRLGKRAFYRMEDMPMDDAFDYLQGMLTANTLAEDAFEGIGAFLEKRDPNWKDK